MADHVSKIEQPAAEPPPPALAAAPMLDRATLTDVVDLALWAGQLLMENGAESQRAEETVRMVGTGLGCDWGDVFISQNAIMVSHSSGDEFRTKLRRLGPPGVNMDMVAAISSLRHRVAEGSYDRLRVRAELQQISATPRLYSRWLTTLVVGLACAAFSRLLGGDWIIFGVTLFSTTVAMVVRHELAQRKFNPILNVLVTAFVAGVLASSASLLGSARPGLALASSVLMLVPGVPFVNAVEDLIKGHTVVGMARATFGILVIVAMALGLILAMNLVGVKTL